MAERTRILIVEDDTTLSAQIASYLREQGFEAATEPNGSVAIRRIQAEAPAAVVLDVTLPGEDGFGVCRAVRPEFRGGILILTARGKDEDVVRGLGFGADDFVRKPVQPRVLLARF